MTRDADDPTEVLSYKVPKSLKAQLQELADRDQRKLGPYIRLVLEDHVAEHKTKQRGGAKKR